MPLHSFLDPQRGQRDERRERLPGTEEERHAHGVWRITGGTLACPACDLPLSPGPPATIDQEIDCPYCDHLGSARDFLTIGGPMAAGAVDVVARLPRAA